jgi:DNA-binding transcriptional LysR family regulator
MNDRLVSLRLFQRVARTLSFSKAGRELGLSQPSVSRLMAQLERSVGASLLVRTTRSVTLTQAGQDYLARLDLVLAALDEADHLARGTGELRGHLKIAMSSSFGVREIIPRLPPFMALHPRLYIDFVISDQRQDLITEGVDVALRLGDLPDSGALARKLAQGERLLAASPAYLEAAAPLNHPSDLAAHRVIGGPSTVPHVLHFTKDSRQTSVRVEGRLTTTAIEAATAAAVCGLGVTIGSVWSCRAELESRALIRVLGDWQLPSVSLNAVFALGKVPTPAARSFVDYLQESLKPISIT